MKIFAWLSQLLYPEKCLLCGKILEKKETDLCHNCRVNAPECPVPKIKIPFLDSWTALWYYEGDVRHSLLRYKFHRRENYAPGYARLLAMKLLTEDRADFDLLTWIPISQKRRRKRGFDQVELLAKFVGHELSVTPVAALEKIRDNQPQSGIAGDAQRRANVLGVYDMIPNADVAGKRILLLDDIVTTGATAGEAARVLLTAGAKEVHLAVVAAAKKPKR